MTPVAAALIPAAATRSAWRRWGVAAYGCFVELGARGLVARSSAPGGVVVAAGGPGAGPVAPQVFNTSGWETGLPGCRAGVGAWGSGGGGVGVSLRAATRAAAARANHGR